MGKEKTDTEQICPNEQQNDRTTSLKDKENSIKTNKSKTDATIKVRKDLTKEVLEDENTNDSNTSTNTKSSQSSSHTSSSTSTSKEDCSSKDLKSKTKDSPKSKDNTISKTDNSTGGEDKTEFRIASNNSTEFKLRIVPLEKLLERPPAPKSPTPTPSIPAANRNSRNKKAANLPTENSRRLPQRRSKPVSFIELSDTEEDSDIIIPSSSESEKNDRTKKQKEASKKKTANKSLSESGEEEAPKSDYKKKKTKKPSSSDSEEEGEKSLRPKNSKKSVPKKSSDSEEEEPIKKKKNKKSSSSDSEEEESRQTKNLATKKSSDSEEEPKSKKSTHQKKSGKSAEDTKKKSANKSNSNKKATNSDTEEDSEEEEAKRSEDSEEQKHKKTTSTRKAGDKSAVSTEAKKSSLKKKETKESSDSEENDDSQTKEKKSKEEEETSKSSSKNNSEKKTLASKEDKEISDSEQVTSSKSNSVSEEDGEVLKKILTNSKRKRLQKTSESEESDSTKARPKRKALQKIVEEKSDSEDEPIKSLSKKKTTGKPSGSGSDDEDKPVKRKHPKKQKSSKAPSGPPPSPSTIRRCSVRVKRSKLSDFKDIGKNKSKSKRKMNGGTRSEKPSTSSARRKHITSDDDSDVSYKRNANIDERLADHDYDGLDNLDEDNDDDNESQKSSDSEIIPTRKRRVFQKDKAEESNHSDSDFEPKQKEKKKKGRIRRNSSGDDTDDEDKKKIKRKDIRKIIKSDDLNVSTKEAAKEEEERRRRIEERQKIYNQIYEKPESAEVTELVLDFDEDTKKSLLEVDKGLVKKLKPHQVTGVKFMWDACFETLKDAQEKPGSGCILAHCMGLGKTMQICTLSHTLLSNSQKTNVERVLIISPLSTLNNWAREFKQWIGFTKKRNIEIYDLSKYKDKQTRIFKLNEWYEEGGVCILGYDMYRILSNEKAKGLRKKQREQLLQSLVDPGPDLVVCDEGHLLKNEKTSISKAVTRMRTLRRIVLTGTPLQNNLKEYYCMIQFIKPNLLGTYKEYLNRFVNPISNGQYTDSTDRDIRLMKHRSHILHKLLEGCIQRRDYSVLAPYLPPKHEYVVYTTLSDLQQLLYEHYMVYQRDLSVIAEGKGAKLFQDFQELRRIWTHPMNMRINSDSVIRKKILADDNDSIEDFICDDDNDEDEAASSSDSSDDNSSKSFGSGGGAKVGGKVAKTRNYRRNATGDDNDSDIEEVAPPPQDDPSEWWKRFVADKELNNINHSPKLVILMRLLEQCEAIGDKLLVFSQSLQSLDTIEHFLALIDSKTRGHEYEGDVGDFRGFWSNGTDYFRLDGSCSVEHRESMCKKFNDSSNLRARLFLISTRAGGLGINLVSANRVVIFDVSWNPSHDTQSIFRVYRFGQDKPCYIYRLIAMGTMEQKLYERQVAKQATAKRVIDEQQISRHYNQSDLQELYTYELKPGTPREIPILPKDRLFAELLTEHERLLFKYHEHDSLLENDQSENLSADERQAAWSEYEAEKTRTVQTAQYMSYDRSAYGQFGNSSGSVTSNKIFGFRSDVLLQLLNLKIAQDHPEMSQNQVIQAVPGYLNMLYTQMNSGDPSMYKDLLSLHASLVHPSGMYMNPLLYVNQNPSAAGYFQAGVQPANGVGGVGVMGGPMAPPMGMPMAPPMAGPPPVGIPAPAPAGGAGFDPDEVYEID